MSFTTKIDYSDNRQLKQYQLTNTVLSGKTTFGVDDIHLPINTTGDTINVDVLQHIRTKGFIFDDGNQQTNYVITSDSRGRSRWKPPLSTTNYGNVNNNYELSRDLGFNFKEGELQEVIISALNDPTLGGIHGFRYVEKYDAIFATDRNDPGTLYKFTDTSDLTQYVTLDLSVNGYTSPDQIVYSPEMDKLYCVMSDIIFNETTFKVWEIDPDNLQKTLVIDYDSSIIIGAPVLTTLGTDIFLINGYYSAKVHKFDLNDYSLTFISSTLGTLAAAHGVVVDAEKLFITSIWDFGGTYIARVNSSTLIIEEIHEFNIEGNDNAGGFTDDIVLVGDYLYLPSEHHDNTGIWKVDKNELSAKTRFDIIKTNITDKFWGIYYDGIDLWYCGNNNLFGKFNPNTLENYSFENPFTYNINELTSDGQTFYVAGFDSYPVTGTTGTTGYVGRVSPPFKALKKKIFNLTGGTISNIDFSTSEMTYELSSASITALISDKTLVNREWVNAQNFGESHASGITFNPYRTITGTTVQIAIEDVKNEIDLLVISGGTGATNLNQLTDVTASATTLGDILISNGGVYINRQLLESDISDFGVYLTGQTDDYITGATFNDTSGYLIMSRLSGNTVTVNLDGRYLTGYTNTDDFVSGATFNTLDDGVLTLEMQSGNTVQVDLDGRYLTSATANTDDFVSGGTFNTLDNGILTLTRESGSTINIDLDGRYLTTATANTDDFVSGATFNQADGWLTLFRQSGNTVTANLDGRYQIGPQTLSFSASTGDLEISDGNIINLDGRYALSGDTSTNTDDYLSGATFNTLDDGVLTLEMQSGSTIQVNLDGRYLTSALANTDDFVSGATFNTSTGELDLEMQSGSTVSVDLDGRYPLLFENIIEIGSDYDTSNQNVDTFKTVRMTGGTQFTLDLSGLTVGFQQQLINNTGGNITLVSSDTLIGTIFPLSDGAFSYYQLVSPTEWIVTIGGTGGIHASGVTFNPYLTLSSTTVQDSIEELKDEVNDLSVSGGTWGGITGVLSAQTDLQTELDAKVNLFENIIEIGSNYDTNGQNIDTFKTVRMTGGTQVTLDKTNLIEGFQQQLLNNTGGDISLVSSDILIGNNTPLSNGSMAYYQLISATEWSITIGGSGGIHASGVTFTPYSSITSTDVQASIEELKDEVDTKLSDVIDDTSPTLGANLNVDSYNIISADGASSYIDINNLGINWYFSNIGGYQDRIVFSNENTGISQSQIKQSYFNDAVFATTIAILESGVNSVFQNNFEHLTAPSLSNANIITSGPQSLITKNYGDTYYSGGTGGGDVYLASANTFTNVNDFENDLVISTNAGVRAGKFYVLDSTIDQFVISTQDGATMLLTGNALTISNSTLNINTTSTFNGQSTFLNNNFKLRNVANTFNGQFTNTNTADRTYTLQNASGTLAFLSDVTGGGIGGSIIDNQVAVGGASANTIEGTSGLTWSNSTLALNALSNSDMIRINGGAASTQYIVFEGTETVGISGNIAYTDLGGTDRLALIMKGDVVKLSNQAANGIVQIKANTATAGPTGSVITAEFEDDLTTFYTNVVGRDDQTTNAPSTYEFITKNYGDTHYSGGTGGGDVYLASANTFTNVNDFDTKVNFNGGWIDLGNVTNYGRIDFYGGGGGAPQAHIELLSSGNDLEIRVNNGDLLVDDDVSITGNLSITGDPSLSGEVGNRGYNDDRYEFRISPNYALAIYTSDWTYGSGWSQVGDTISGTNAFGKLSFDGLGGADNGDAYIVEIVISSYTTGTLRIQSGNLSQKIGFIDKVGTFRYRVDETFGGTGFDITIDGYINFTGVISKIRILKDTGNRGEYDVQALGQSDGIQVSKGINGIWEISGENLLGRRIQSAGSTIPSVTGYINEDVTYSYNATGITTTDVWEVNGWSSSETARAEVIQQTNNGKVQFSGTVRGITINSMLGSTVRTSGRYAVAQLIWVSSTSVIIRGDIEAY